MYHCMYVAHLYLFICLWTFRLFLCPVYCKYCCNEHSGACFLLNYTFLKIYDQWQDCCVIWQFHVQFSEELPYSFLQRLHQFSFLPTVQECSLFSTTSAEFSVCRLFDKGRFDRYELIPHFSLICILIRFMMLKAFCVIKKKQHCEQK